MASQPKIKTVLKPPTAQPKKQANATVSTNDGVTSPKIVR